MAKRKRSLSKQYSLYYNALSYYGIKSKQLKRPTAKSVANLKSQWQGIKSERKKHGMTTPTVYEARNLYLSNLPTSTEGKPSIYDVPRTEEPKPFEQVQRENYDSYFQDLYFKIRSTGKTEVNLHNGTVNRIDEAKEALIQQIEAARMKIADDSILITMLEDNSFKENLDMYMLLPSDNIGEYIDCIEDELPYLIESIVNHVLNTIY